MSDTKHGWVSPRADGQRARCGGPGFCTTCNTEAMHEKMLTGLFGAPAPAPAPTPHGEQAEHEVVDTGSFDDPSALAAAADALSGDTSNDNAQFAAAYLYRQAKALAAPPCPTCNDQGAVGNILTAQPCPDCAAPASPVSTVEDAGAQKVVIDFDQVGSAGPFHVIDGRVTIPAVTVMDLVRMASPSAGDAQTDAAPEWATCESRGPWARNSLKAVIDLLRGKETQVRHAFTKDYMGLPARYIADAYGEAAAVVELKLSAIAAQRQGDA